MTLLSTKAMIPRAPLRPVEGCIKLDAGRARKDRGTTPHRIRSRRVLQSEKADVIANGEILGVGHTRRAEQPYGGVDQQIAAAPAGAIERRLTGVLPNLFSGRARSPSAPPPLLERLFLPIFRPPLGALGESALPLIGVRIRGFAPGGSLGSRVPRR